MDSVGEYKEKHEFALWVQSLSLVLQKKDIGDTIIFYDTILFHRMVNVLRLHSGDRCIFFDRDIFIKATIVAFSGKKQISVIIQEKQFSIVLRPHITFLLPLLKRDDLE